MNVDKLKKMNVLADTLKQHGLAATREDAANLAGDMVGPYDQEEFSKVFVQPDQSISIRDSEDGELQEIQEQKEEKPMFDENQIKNILQSFADQFSAEIKKMSEKLDTQEERLEKLYEMMQKQPEPVGTPQVIEEPKEETAIVEPEPGQARETSTTQEKIVPVQEAAKTSGDSPRSGGFSSEDVAIDKFFYYGQR